LPKESRSVLVSMIDSHNVYSHSIYAAVAHELHILFADSYPPMDIYTFMSDGFRVR
jgi:hypothetical protein